MDQRILPWFLLNSSKLFSEFRQGKEERNKVGEEGAAWREFWYLDLILAYLARPNFPDPDPGGRMPCGLIFCLLGIPLAEKRAQ